MSDHTKYCQYCGQPGERYYSPETLATILDCSVETVRDWIKKRTLGSVKIGGLRRIPASEIEKITIQLPSLQDFTEEALAE